MKRLSHTWASFPDVRVRDMDLAGGVMEAQEASRNNRNRVLLVVDARERRDMSVDVVRERLISDLFREVSGRDRRRDTSETHPG